MHDAAIGNPGIGAGVVGAVTIHAPFDVPAAHAPIPIVTIVIIVRIVSESAPYDQRKSPPRRLVIIPAVEMAAVAPTLPTAITVTVAVPFHIAAVFLCDLDEARIADTIVEPTGR